MKKIIILALLIIVITTMFTACREADKVSYNISQEADNFNIIRRLVVINARTDKPLIEIVGAFSFELEKNRIIVIIEVGDGVYKKHSVGLNEWTLWDVEDLSGAEVNKYRYEVNFLPESIVPITFVNKD